MSDRDDIDAGDSLEGIPSEPVGASIDGRAHHARGGPLAWFARNSVAANILMIVLLVGGYLNLKKIKQEVFPEFALDIIVINIPYPGASPAEVEQGVVLAAEEAVRAVDGIKRVTSTATEGYAVLVVELLLGTDADQALNDIKASIDRVTSFPEDVERPNVFNVTNRFQVVSLVYYGDVSEHSLRALGERARDDLLQEDDITVVSLGGIRPLEISIEVAQHKLLEVGMTLDQIAGIIRAACVEVPGGGVKTARGEVLVKTDERCNNAEDFENVTLRSNAAGTILRVQDVAHVKDGFAEAELEARYNGKPAVRVDVFRVGDQKPLDISEAVQDYVERERDALPPGVELATWFDTSEFYADRIDLLLRNATYGLILVIIVLGLFLEMRLAFWVTLGIPISFVGTLFFMPSTSVSINMISLFAFIIVLGMVVDDAIIVGEAIYKRRQDGMGRMEAAVQGVREVAVPVTFAIVTTIMAYAPLLFVPGPAGKFFRVVPIVVIIVLTISLVESLLILPAHLAHSKEPTPGGIGGWLHEQQQKFSRLLERFIERVYTPFVRGAARRRYLTLCVCVGFMIASFGLVAGGRLKFTFLPKVDSDVVTAGVELPYGASFDRTDAVADRMLATARETIAEYGSEDELSRGIYTQVGASGLAQSGPRRNFGAAGGSHLAEVSVYLVPTDRRPMTASEFAKRWRKKLEDTPGVERLTFQFQTGPAAGEPVNVELSHPRMDVLYQAAGALATRLEEFDGVYDIDDGFAQGKEQLNLKLRPEARSLGITELELARQVRSAFFGAEAVRQQRGRDEVRVYVRLPRDERESEFNIEELILRTPLGGEVMLKDAAEVSRGRSHTEIKRIDGRQAVAVTAQVDESSGNAVQIMARVQNEVLPELIKEYPGLAYSVGGEEKERAEINENLGAGMLLACLAMFALLAVAFRSYIQPLIIMIVIPFGFVGAIWGHLFMGYNLSLMSMMGVVALAGVVVNDSLILVVSANRFRESGMPLLDAVVAGGSRRFRPILLTSVTTFCGLAPMIVETSLQARFLIPMAVSLGFGVLFATFITLILVPAVYMIVDDIARALKRLYRAVMALYESQKDPPPTQPPASAEDDASG